MSVERVGAKPAAGERNGQSIWWAARAAEAGYPDAEALTEALGAAALSPGADLSRGH